MPTLKQLTCSIERGPSCTPLREYNTSYGDGLVETFVGVPSQPEPFSIHLTSNGFIASGLAMFVYIDGVPQCNRNRRGLVIPDAKRERWQTEIDFRVRQKEEKLDSGRWIGREWTFATLKTAAADASADLSKDVLDNVGTIEVVVLRCYADGDPAGGYYVPDKRKTTGKNAKTPASRGSVDKYAKARAINSVDDGGLDGTAVDTLDGAGDERPGSTSVGAPFGMDGSADDNNNWGNNDSGAGQPGQSGGWDNDNNKNGPAWNDDSSGNWNQGDSVNNQPQNGNDANNDWNQGNSWNNAPWGEGDNNQQNAGNEGNHPSIEPYPVTSEGSLDGASHRGSVAGPGGITINQFVGPDHLNGLNDAFRRHGVQLNSPAGSVRSAAGPYQGGPSDWNNQQPPPMMPGALGAYGPPNPPQPANGGRVPLQPQQQPWNGYAVPWQGNPGFALPQGQTLQQMQQQPAYGGHQHAYSGDTAINPGLQNHYQQTWGRPHPPPPAPPPPSNKAFNSGFNQQQGRNPNNGGIMHVGTGTYQAKNQRNTSNPPRNNSNGHGNSNNGQNGQNEGWNNAPPNNGNGNQNKNGNNWSNQSPNNGNGNNWNSPPPNNGSGNQNNGQNGNWENQNQGNNNDSWNNNQSNGNAENSWKNQDQGNNGGGNDDWRNNDTQQNNDNNGGNDSWSNNDAQQNGDNNGGDDRGNGNNDQQNNSSADDWANNTGNNNSSNNANASGGWDQPAQPTTDNAAWDTAPAPAASTPKNAAKTSSAKKATSTSGANPPSSNPHIKQYWLQGSRPVAFSSLGQNTKRTPHLLPSEPLYPLPAAHATEEKISHQVQAGKGVIYQHKVGKPAYIDSIRAPYAVFVFRYRSDENLEVILGENISPMPKTQKEKQAFKDRMMALSKEELLKELGRAKKAAGYGTESTLSSSSSEDEDEGKGGDGNAKPQQKAKEDVVIKKVGTGVWTGSKKKDDGGGGKKDEWNSGEDAGGAGGVKW